MGVSSELTEVSSELRGLTAKLSGVSSGQMEVSSKLAGLAELMGLTAN
jgi:hypothetical protein